MKNQYFGDINDYRKYGLLRLLADVAGQRLMVCWILTPDDGSSDGRKRAYLDQPAAFRHHDPDLFTILRDLHEHRDGLHRFERTGAIAGARFFSELFHDDRQRRTATVESLNSRLQDTDCVFFDPDNGLEVKSRPYGRRHSAKYLYWHEAVAAWEAGKSLLIYQHYPRRARIPYLEQLRDQTSARLAGAAMTVYSTAHVAFLHLVQPHHRRAASRAAQAVASRWNGQFEVHRPG